MSELILPQWVAKREARRAILEDQSSGLAQTRYWNPLLHQIDPGLSLVFVGRVDGEEAGVVPYRWHIVRHVPGSPDTYWSITTDGLGKGGPFREMGSDVLETLRAGDLWNESVIYDRRVQQARIAASKERAKETRKEARVQDLALNIRATDSPGVSFADTGWTWRKSGRRGRSAR